MIKVKILEMRRLLIYLTNVKKKQTKKKKTKKKNLDLT